MKQNQRLLPLQEERLPIVGEAQVQVGGPREQCHISAVHHAQADYPRRWTDQSNQPMTPKGGKRWGKVVGREGRGQAARVGSTYCDWFS